MHPLLLSLSLKHQCTLVYYGVSKDDALTHMGERTHEYLTSFQTLLNSIQPTYDVDNFLLPKVELEAPVILLNESRIIRLGNTYNIPWNLTWCCEHAFEKHCGVCMSCIRRKYAFREEGSNDPTEYSDVSWLDSFKRRKE